MKRIYTMIFRVVASAAVAALCSLGALAQESVMPRSWSYNKETGIYRQSDGLELYKHEKSSQHFDVYYGVGYGTKAPDKLSKSDALYVDVADLLSKAESFFDLYVNKLKFSDLEGNSKLNKYKMIIVLLHDTGWTATGSGYDNTIGALWVTPSTCHPVGQTIAHEIGHAFQYQVFCDLGGYTGFRESVGNGSTFWEQTAQWQSVQAYPNLMIDQSLFVWRNAHNYAFTHEWQRYQSYWLHYYWTDKHGIDAVGRVWRGATAKGQDPCQVYMSVFGVSVNDFYKEIFDYACKMVTYDLDEIRSYGRNYIGDYTYNYIDTDDDKIQVAYSSCPQATGFNVIPLRVPAAGTEIKTIFTALAPGCAIDKNDRPQFFNGASQYENIDVTNYNSYSQSSKRGFRHGYVALLDDGTRVYGSEDMVYGKGTVKKLDETTFVVPKGTKRLWFVVSPAPTQYIVHRWDEKIANDDQFPYQLEFENTDIVGRTPKVDLSDASIAAKDTLIEVHLSLAPSAEDETGCTYMLSRKDLKAIGEALRIQPANIASIMKAYSSGQAMYTLNLVPLGPKTNAVVSKGSTTSGYGHWFDIEGSVCSYSDKAAICSQFDPSQLTFTIKQRPGRLVAGETYKIGQGLRYKTSSGAMKTAKIVFYIAAEGGNGIGNISADSATPNAKRGIYDLAGRCYSAAAKLRPGFYVIDGKKQLVR